MYIPVGGKRVNNLARIGTRHADILRPVGQSEPDTTSVLNPATSPFDGIDG